MKKLKAKCQECGKVFEYKYSTTQRRKFCHPDCYKKSRKKSGHGKITFGKGD